MLTNPYHRIEFEYNIEVREEAFPDRLSHK